MMLLGEMLVLEGVISQNQLDNALERQRVMGGRIGTNLLELNYLTEVQLIQYLSKQRNIPAAPPTALDNIDEKVIALVPNQIASDYKVVPFLKERHHLHLAMLDPLDLAAIDALSFIASSTIKIYIATEARIYFALQKYYQITPRYRFQQVIMKLQDSGKMVAPLAPLTPRTPPTTSMSSKKADKNTKDSKAVFLAAESRRKIIGALCNELVKHLERIIIYIIDNNVIAFWDDLSEFHEERKGEIISINLSEPSFLRDHLRSSDTYIGPLEHNRQNTKLIGALGDIYPAEVVILPVTLGKDSICVVYGDNLLSAKSIENPETIKRLHIITLYAIKIYYMKKKIADLTDLI